MRTSDLAEVARAHDRILHPGGMSVTERGCLLAGFLSGARLLDVGCGAGATLRFLCGLGFDARGVEPDGRLRALCAASGADVVDGFAESLPFPDGTFDGVLFECSLSLVSDRRRAVSEAARVLVDGGRIVVQDLYRADGMSCGRDAATDRAESGGVLSGCAEGAATPDGWMALLEEANFSLTVREDHTDELRSFVARSIFYDLPLPFACSGTGMRARRGYLLLVGRKGVSDGE